MRYQVTVQVPVVVKNKYNGDSEEQVLAKSDDLIQAKNLVWDLVADGYAVSLFDTVADDIIPVE